jgi:hypothetical protein
MSKRSRMFLSAVALTLGTLALAAPAYAEGGVKIGVLTCNVDSGCGFILGSSKDIRCNFSPDRGNNDRYFGTITKLGVDIGYTKGGVLIWDVFAPSSSLRDGVLEGSYAGVTASATVGVGVGANVLLGGFERSVALQPVSIEGNTGLNVAAGIGEINLKRDRS